MNPPRHVIEVGGLQLCRQPYLESWSPPTSKFQAGGVYASMTQLYSFFTLRKVWTFLKVGPMWTLSMPFVYVSSSLPDHKWCHMFQFCIWIIIVIKWTGPWHFVMSLSNIWNYFRESVNTISTYNLNNFSHSLHTNLKYNRIVLLMLCNEISNKGEMQSKLFPKFQDFRDLGFSLTIKTHNTIIINEQ